MNNGISNINHPGCSSAVAGSSLGGKVSERSTEAAGPIPAAIKAQILDSLAKVDPNSFAGYCIRVFVGEVHLKTNTQIRHCIHNLQDQINSNPKQMKAVLGDQFEFIRTVTF